MSNTINFPSSSTRPTQTDPSALTKHSGPLPITPSSVYQADKPAVTIKGDQTSLSTTSGLIAAALSGSDVRTAKVASLQQSISTGTYRVDSSKVADKLLQSLLGE